MRSSFLNSILSFLVILVVVYFVVVVPMNRIYGARTPADGSRCAARADQRRVLLADIRDLLRQQRV